MYSSALGIDFCLGNDTRVPSMDDWGSAQEGAGYVSLGLLAHDAGRQIFEKALPNWDRMMPDNDGNNEDDRRRSETGFRNIDGPHVHMGFNGAWGCPALHRTIHMGRARQPRFRKAIFIS